MAYKIISEGSNFYTVRGVPIFQMHTNRGFPCDETWMSDAVQNHALLKAGGYRPTIIIGHNKKGGVEKEAVGFLDNLVIKGKLLYADLVRIPGAIKEKIIKNAFPNRSVEVLPKSKRILCMALLGGTTPHFALPQVVFANKEESEWYPYERDNKMLNDEIKREIYELVGAAVSETVPEVLTACFSNNEGEEEPETFIDPETNEEYAVPAGLAKLLSAGGKVAGKVAGKRGKQAFGKTAGKAVGKFGKAGAAMGRHPGRTAAGFGAGGAILGSAAGEASSRRDRRAGYSIDEETGEVCFAGEPVGLIVTYEELAEAGMDVPTAPKHPEELPPTEEARPKLKIKEGDVGVGSGTDMTLVTPVAAPGGPALIDPLDREASDQFELQSELVAQNYDLHQRLSTVENANALITSGRRAEEYEVWLTSQKASGAPVGDISKTVEYMMSQAPEQVEEFKQLLLSSPKVALGRLDDVKQFELTDETALKAEYAANKETYAALGVTAKDLSYAKYIRTNAGISEAMVTG